MLERLSFRRDASLSGVMIGLAVFGFVIWNNFRNEKSLQREARAALAEIVESSPRYADHSQIFDEWITLAHDEAFRRAYHRGGRRAAASFEPRLYWLEAMQTLVEECSRAGFDEDAAYFLQILRSDPRAERLLTNP